MQKPSAQQEVTSSGFSLIQLSIILTIAALLMAAVIPGREAGDLNRKALDDTAKLAKIEDAMKGFMALNGRRPCPADGQYTVNDHNFGIEAANAGSCTGGTPAAPLGPDPGTGNVVAGVVPTKSLNIPDEWAFDSFGRRFTYAVDKRATGQNTCLALQSRNNLGVGGIQINDGTGNPVDSVMVAYVGHGPVGHGAWPMQSTGSGGPLVNGSPDTERLNNGSTDPDVLNNANVDMNFNTNFDNVFVKKDPTATFDQLVYYEGPTKNKCCVGPVCSPLGFRVDGTLTGQRTGVTLAVGDVNGDGIPDLILTDPWGSPEQAVYVVFGTQNGFPNPLPLNTLNGSNGFKVINGGFARVGAGDINGDGFSDVIMSSCCSIYALFGHADPWPATVDASVMADGTHGFLIVGSGTRYGNEILTTGDLNGDKVADLIFDDAGSAGRIYTLFGHPNPWPASFDPETVADGTQGFYLTDRTNQPQTPHTVAVGDVNGDGIPDLLVGETEGIGVVDVVFGHAGSWLSENGVALGTLPAAQSAYFYNSSVTGWDYFGVGLAVGDVNGDGVNEILIGQPYGGYGSVYHAGTVFVVSTLGLWGSARYDINTLLSQGKAAHIDANQSTGEDGIAVADLNGDGIGDIIFSCAACTTDSPNGSVYIVYGQPGSPTNLDLATNPLNGTNGLRIDCSYAPDAGYCGGNGAWSGYMLTGDLNGDGFSDLVIANSQGTGSGQSNSGYTYIVFGNNAKVWVNPLLLSRIQ